MNRATLIILMGAFLGAPFSLGAQEQRLEVGTYNVGLAHGYVAFAEERLKLIPGFIKKNAPDVLCLQEVWNQRDLDYLKTELKDIYPNVLTVEAKKQLTPSAPSCSPFDLIGKGKFLSCFVSQCLSKSGEEQTTCLLKSCSTPLETLRNENSTCAQALFSQVGKGPLTAIWNVLNPFKAAHILAYEGSSGLALFSKRLLTQENILDFAEDSSINRRAVIHGKWAHLPGKEIQIYCTHLTANLEGEVPYPGKFSGWAEETTFQAQKIKEYIESQKGPGILLGDLNCSFKDQGACQVLKGINLVGISELSSNMGCSFCASNPLVKKGTEDKVIDHIVLFGEGAFGEIKRTMEDVSALSPDRVGPMSDHFGVSAYIIYP